MNKKNAQDYKTEHVIAQVKYEIEDGITITKDLLLHLVKRGIKDVAENGPWLLSVHDNGTWTNVFLSNNAIGFQWHIVKNKLEFKGVFDSTFALSNEKLTKQMKRNLAK